MPEFVFVYGSLRKNLWGYDQYLQGLDPVLSSRISGFNMYTIIGQNYPFCIVGDGEVTGEVYEINQRILAMLDSFEDCPREYIRVLIKIGEVSAWIYIYNLPMAHPNFHKVEGGDWVEYLKLTKE